MKEEMMPLIQFDTVEGALDKETKKTLADALTACVVDVIGEKIKDHTWVMINERPEGNFFVGGHKLSAKIYHKIMHENHLKKAQL
jgi:phenylpyruvate tautomerase PptA (4-oxalocrotonate tautomerase family)